MESKETRFNSKISFENILRNVASSSAIETNENIEKIYLKLKLNSPKYEVDLYNDK